MFRKIIFFTFAVISFGSSFAYSFSNCNSLLDTSLSNQQIGALKVASASRNVALLTSKNFNDSGKKQIVIVLGESHIKGRKRHTEEMEVLKQFPNRALEGFKGTENYLFNAINFLMEASLSGVRLFTLGAGPYDSALEYAKKVPVESEKEIKVFPLERQIIEKTRESKMADVHLAGTFGCLIGSICLAGAAELSQSPQLMLPAFSLVGLALIDTAFLGVTSALKNRFKKHKKKNWYKNLFHVWIGVVNSRDTLMGENALEALSVLGGEPLLLIVGSNHVKGIKEFLEEKGFSSLPLD